MMLVSLLSWWYSRGWLWAASRINSRLAHIGQVFAITTLLTTWLAPWKQIYTPKNFQNFLQVSVDNAISRVVGVIVRTSVLMVAFVWSIFEVVYGVVILLLWPFMPLAVVALPLLAAAGVTL